MARNAFALTLVLAAGCGGEPGSQPPEPDAETDSGFDRRAMLDHLASDFFEPAHQAFAEVAAALPTAIGAYCTALESGAGATELGAAQQGWRDTIDAWERVDAVLVGPAAMDGKTLRDRIYAWPLLATCGIDREVTAHWSAPGTYDVTTELANVRSLAAVEYLMFEDSAAHTCAAPPTGWDALGADLPKARCGLAAAIAADVAVGADLALAGWDTYHAGLVDGPSLRESVNVVSDALFYLDTMVKDMKVGEAAGITVNACGAIELPCEREVEHRYADHGRAAILANLRALREVYTGTTVTADGPGFDDNLRALGATELADRITASIDGAVAAAEALPASYLGALTAQRADVVAMHAAMRLITDDLKSQFLTVLGLDIPDEIAGDND